MEQNKQKIICMSFFFFFLRNLFMGLLSYLNKKTYVNHKTTHQKQRSPSKEAACGILLKA